MLATGVSLLFWWPLSHWFYPDAYHQFLGFEPGSYQDDMVKVIGTTGTMPVLLVLFSAMDPVRNRHVNVTFSAGAALFLAVVYPWRGGPQTPPADSGRGTTEVTARNDRICSSSAHRQN